jgi:hypothetical protein
MHRVITMKPLLSLVFLFFTLLEVSVALSPRRNAPSRSSLTTLRMGVSTAVRRVRDSMLSKERSREDLKIGIAGFYDRSSKLWEDVWGEVRRRCGARKTNVSFV